MKIKTLLLLPLLFLMSCESQIYHNYQVTNKTQTDIVIEYSLSSQPDSVIEMLILSDSTNTIYLDSNIQDFYTSKIQPEAPNLIINKVEIINDTLKTGINYASDTSNWEVYYEPGKYLYQLKIISL